MELKDMLEDVFGSTEEEKKIEEMFNLCAEAFFVRQMRRMAVRMKAGIKIDQQNDAMSTMNQWDELCKQAAINGMKSSLKWLEDKKDEYAKKAEDLKKDPNKE